MMQDGSYTKDVELARKAWEVFHAKRNPPKEINLPKKARKWPTKWGFGGKVKTLFYRSSKWEKNDEYFNYYHDHGEGIMVFQPLGEAPWLDPRDPQIKRFPQATSVLGYCLGWDFVRPDNGKVYRANPEDGKELLTCFPDRRHLVVVHPDNGIVALIYGPGLRVEARGIVG